MPLLGVTLALACFVGVACSSKPKAKPAVTTTLQRPTTTPQPGPRAPLTGLSESPAAAGRCAVSVKIGNTADARPQFGLDDADVVYEIVVDGGITRLLAVFQSKAPEKVGTMRSVRPTDRTILEPLRGVFAFSGGNQIEMDSINGAPVLQLDETRAGDTVFRDPAGRPPNNLYANVARMYDRCSEGAPQPLFSYRKAGAAVPGKPTRSVHVGFRSPFDVSWAWDAKQKTWLRDRLGGPDIQAGDYRVRAANVVVMSITHTPSPEAADGAGIIDGTGPAVVLTAGKAIRGTWSRPDRAKPARLLDESGKEIGLTPGNTWVELPDVSYPVTTDP